MKKTQSDRSLVEPITPRSYEAAKHQVKSKQRKNKVIEVNFTLEDVREVVTEEIGKSEEKIDLKIKNAEQSIVIWIGSLIVIALVGSIGAFVKFGIPAIAAGIAAN